MSARRSRPGALGATLLVLTLGGPLAAAPLKVQGSTTVNPIVVEAAERLTAAEGLEIYVDTLGGSSGGLHALGRREVDLAMLSRPLEESDRRRFPEADFRTFVLGWDGVALVVSSDVWEGGVRSLSRAQMQAIYERRIRNWRQLGGPDLRLAFFNKEPGRGTWEVFARWLYGDAATAPPVAHREVGSNEEVRTKVGATPGALSQLSAAWVDEVRLFALAVEEPGGERLAPKAAAIASGHYPLRRPLLLVSHGPPAGAAARLLSYLLSPTGQSLVAEHGYLPRRGAAPPEAP